MLIKKIILEIIDEANLIIKKRINENLLIDLVDIFPKDKNEKEKLTKEIQKISKKISSTNTGNIYYLDNSILTKFGPLSLIKIRIVDKNKTQRGAPDFKVKNYSNFKKKYLNKKGFKLIIRKDYEMLEFQGKNLLIYFPNETLSESLEIKNDNKLPKESL